MGRNRARRERGATTDFPSVHEGRLPEMRLPIAIDSYSNAPARLGVGTDNLVEASAYPLIRLTEDYPLMLSLFRGSWLIRRIVEVIPNLMLKSFPKLDTELKPDLIKNFERVIRKTGTLAKLRAAAKWGRLFGGAGAIIVIKGHDDLSQPLRLDDIELGSYKGLIPLDRWSGIIPGAELNEDIEDTINFGLPKYYNCVMDRGAINVHSSRIIRFIGRELPQWEKQVELYWGESEVEVVFDELKKRDYSSWNIVSLLTRAQVIAMTEPELAAMRAGAAGGGRNYDNYVQRMESISALLNNQGLLILGKDGDLKSNTYSFGGVADVYHEFMKDFAAAAEHPYEILFGRESGLGSNGESSLQMFYDTLEMKRTSELDPAMDQLMPVVAMSTFGEVPDDLDHHWEPIRSMTDKERAELAKAHADSINGYFQSDLITKREARLEIQTSASVTGLGTNLTDEAVAATPDKYASELGMGEMGGMGGEGGGQPGGVLEGGEEGGEAETEGEGSEKTENPSERRPDQASLPRQASPQTRPKAEPEGESEDSQDFTERRADRYVLPRTVESGGRAMPEPVTRELPEFVRR